MRRFFTLLCILLLLTGCASPLPAPDPADAPAPSAGQPEASPGPLPALDPEPYSPPESKQPPEPLSSTDPAPAEPLDTDFVRVADYISGILVDLRYATDGNFTGTVIYDFTDAYLRYGTVKKLSAVQEALAAQGYGLLIWDAFRPTAAQFALWEVCPDPRYVANPTSGFSSHSRGNTVDLTLVTLDGAEVEMPTGFDDFTALADRDYSDVPDTAAANALLLETAMAEAGFRPYQGEWWHFSDSDSYEVEEQFSP